MTLYQKVKNIVFEVKDGLESFCSGCKLGLGIAVTTGSLLASILSCSYSPPTETKKEKINVQDTGIVKQLIYSPPMKVEGDNLLLTSKGFIFVFDAEAKIKEKYGVIFKCPKGKVVIQGADSMHQAIYDKFDVGDTALINYTELYSSTYQDTNNDGKKELTKRELVSRDFVDAYQK